MNPKYLRVLEFDKILDRLASHAAFSASEQLARDLIPSTDPGDIARRQAETSEARDLLDQHPEMGVGGARDVRHHARNARLGAMLSPLDLLDIRQTLLAARTLRRALAKLDALYPKLATRAALIQELPSVVDTIGRAVNDRGDISDNASSELARIRRELNTTRSRLHDKLQRIIQSQAYAKLLQEAIITQRDGRYVIPIRAESKSKIQGIVHDTSASGATVFIEPLATVEMGNRVRELERAEEREVERILRELTALIAAHADAVDLIVETLAQIDLALAKAKYSVAIRGTQPVIASEAKQSPSFKEIASSRDPSTSLRSTQDALLAMTQLELKAARHPLLDPEKVVPISIELGNERVLSGVEGFSILIITGPNTGGKTVTLKTVGLLALMAQSGMHLPVQSARLPIFSGIYADIGDEQSIEQSLSTFSSHLTNIVEILRDADARSLVLLDELGAGTDPIEGSALARAILTHLLDDHIPALVATHYPELKAFAQTTPGVQNASMEFDVETLSPTFHLSIGLPGESNAFAIATRLGLDPGIIESARAALGTADVEMEELLADIKRAQQDAASARTHAESAQREAEKNAADLKERLREIEQSREEILERARDEAQSEVELARAELNRLRQEWRAVSVTREFVENAREKLEAVETGLELSPQPIPPTPLSKGGFRGDIEIGDRVSIARLGQRGDVIALDDEGADVQVGSFRVRVKLDELEKISGAPPSRVIDDQREFTPVVESPGMEVSLRGMRADDALILLEKYLDRAYLAGLPFVRIVHGKGTGTLRKLTRELLSEHPLVAEIREAETREGGEGVTIAKLVAR